MIPMAFEYERAASLRDALKAVGANDGTKVLAGGHSLLPLMKLRLGWAPKVVDIAHLEELRGVEEHRRGARIGSGTTYRELLSSGLLLERFPIIGEAARVVADLQVRNRGTLGGSLVHADPASDMPAVMLALDARMRLRSKRRKRTVAAREFFKGPFETAMEPDELLIDIELPGPPRSGGSAYVSFRQLASVYAMAGAAVVMKVSRRRIKECALAFTGVADRVFLASTDGLVNTKGETEIIAEVARKSVDGVDVVSDIHAPQDYRRQLAAMAAARALTTALSRAQ